MRRQEGVGLFVFQKIPSDFGNPGASWFYAEAASKLKYGTDLARVEWLENRMRVITEIYSVLSGSKTLYKTPRLNSFYEKQKSNRHFGNHGSFHLWNGSSRIIACI